jgi:hypothetical protein
MYDDVISDTLKEAGVRADRRAKGDDWWIEALREAADEELALRREAGGDPRPKGKAGKKRSAVRQESVDPGRLQTIRQAHDKLAAQKRCSAGCGSPETGWKGMCQPCYNKTYRKDRGGTFWKLCYGKHRPVFAMVKEMARQEKRNVSEMIMVMLASEITRRLQGQTENPPASRRKPRAGT